MQNNNTVKCFNLNIMKIFNSSCNNTLDIQKNRRFCKALNFSYVLHFKILHVLQKQVECAKINYSFSHKGCIVFFR